MLQFKEKEKKTTLIDITFKRDISLVISRILKDPTMESVGWKGHIISKGVGEVSGFTDSVKKHWGTGE